MRAWIETKGSSFLAFTTWTALKQQMLDDLASGKTLTAEYEVRHADGSLHRQKFRTLGEWSKFFALVEARAAAEGTQAPVGRTFAKQGGRG